MRFVEVKTGNQQARAILFRAREQLVRQRTDLVNASPTKGTSSKSWMNPTVNCPT
jgi:transposase